MTQMTQLKFSKQILSLSDGPLLLSPSEREMRRGRKYRVRLGANESVFGTSPVALRSAREAQTALAFYGDPNNTPLRERIAARWGCTTECIVVGEGIEGLLELFARAFVDCSDNVVMSKGTYPTLRRYVTAAGGCVIDVPYLKSGILDYSGLIAATKDSRAKLLYLANPDNPTGTLAASTMLLNLIDELPRSCVLLLDEAYAEFAPSSAIVDLSLIQPNLIRLRTFSKAYGLAGARVGYAVAFPIVVQSVERIRQRYGVSSVSQCMAAAALGDDIFLAEVVANVAKGRDQYNQIAANIGARTLPSWANFVAFDFGDERESDRIIEKLELHDIYAVRPAVEPLNRLIRVTVGDSAQRQYLSEVLESG